jgi:hypothetical protein
MKKQLKTYRVYWGPKKNMNQTMGSVDIRATTEAKARKEIQKYFKAWLVYEMKVHYVQEI